MATGEEALSVRKIIHVDMDAFFASVEQRDNPEYRGKPIVVGGSPNKRGVVAAASYEARKFGIRSAMPSRTASMRCPGLIFVKPRFEQYSSVSRQIREIFHRHTDLVEPLSLDEAYLDVTENKTGNPSATRIAQEIKSSILEETGLTASAGISVNKFLAKTASGINKPNGLFLIRPQDAEGFVEKLEIERFYGVGKVTAEKMRSYGISNGADLKRKTLEELVRIFGSSGHYYYQIARGQDDRPVSPNRERKSIGAERSYAEDLEGLDSIRESLVGIAEILCDRINGKSEGGRTLTLKVKYSDYHQITRSKTSAGLFAEVAEIVEAGNELLAATEVETRNVRLLGLAISNLAEESDDTQFVQLKLDLGG